MFISLTTACYRAKNFEKSMEYAKAAIESAEKLGNEAETALLLKNMGSICLLCEETLQAIVYYEKALGIMHQLKDKKGERRVLLNLAEAYPFLGDYKKSLEYYTKASEIEGHFEVEAEFYLSLGQAQFKANQDYISAEKSYKKGLQIAQSKQNRSIECSIYEKLSDLYRDVGRYEEALTHGEKALQSALQLRPFLDKEEYLDHCIGAYMTLGNICETLGDYDRGLKFQCNALAFAKELGNPRNQAKAYINIGVSLARFNDHEQARELFRNALQNIKKTDLFSQGAIYVNLGHSYYACKDYKQAKELYEKSLEISKSLNDLSLEKGSQMGLGLALMELKDPEKAFEHYNIALHLAKQANDRLGEAAVYQNLGELFRESDFGKAKEYYKKSIEVFSSLQNELGAHHHQWKITIFEEQSKAYRRLESLLIKQSEIDEAFQLTDLRRSRALVSILLKKLNKSQLLSEEPIKPKEIQALAQKLNTTFIIYSFSDESSFGAWVIPPQGRIRREPLPFDRLPEEIKDLESIHKKFPFINVRPSAPPKKPTKGESAKNIPEPSPSIPFLKEMQELHQGGPSEETPARKDFKKRLGDWYDVFITPIEQYLPEDPEQTLTIVPDDFLSQIPFAAFRDKEGKYLIQKHPISIAPSLKVLQLLDQFPKEFPQNSLVVGNPTTPNPKEALKLSGEEAEKVVAPLLKTPEENILLKEKAVVSEIIKRISQAQWIHFACHGEADKKLDPHSVFEGILKLGKDENHPNGYLYAQEISSLFLHASLVFMSACFSGRGKLQEEGSIGHIWSFLAAGALSTIATHWRLPESDLTVEMVKTFYSHLLGIGTKKLNKAQALQKAILLGIEKDRENPHRWGAFFLSGLNQSIEESDFKKDINAN